MATSNKDTTLRFFEALVTADGATVMELIHDDFRYFYPGSMPTGGWWDRDGFFASGTMFAGKLAGPITMRIGDVTAEDDRVWVEAESEADLVDGGRYENSYIMAFHVKDGRVSEFKEFGDTLMTYEAMDVPAVRGPRKPRASSIGAVSQTFLGASIGNA